jgi:CopG family transcriptional regulator, nickel-responsive regulator
MQRFTISLDDGLAVEFDRLIAERGYVNRSEAVRDLLRGLLDRQAEAAQPQSSCVACLSYVFNHHERELAERLLSLQHEHHDLMVSTTHAHLDHDHCIETSILRGPAPAVRRFAERLIAERGVHHGQLNLVLTESTRRHRHGSGHTHEHQRPRH